MLVRSTLGRLPFLPSTSILIPFKPIRSKNIIIPINSFRSLSTTRSFRYPSPTPLSPTPIPSASTSSPNALPLTFAARSRIFRNSTRKQILELQTELELLRSRYPYAKNNSKKMIVLFSLFLLSSGLFITYQVSSDFRRVILAAKRSALVGIGVAKCIINYKILFRKTWAEDEVGRIERHNDYENCHRRCAEIMREVLKKNGGIFIKLGQHISSIQLIPTPWSETMKPLQDQCFPTSLKDLEALFLSDVGAPLSTFFSSFDPVPIGVASLAQVHVAIDRESGRSVAVKLMHPELEEFCAVDIRTTVVLLGWVKRIFPSFEFTWLGEEMEQNLPLEMDFRHEAANARRCEADFANLEKTTLVIPEVLWAKKRVLVMEYIVGSRIDDLKYLADHNIDRNKVAQQLSHIFSRMIYITGFFHADPHGGNLLIRPRQPNSRSPYNFEIVLLDHGLYFDMSEELRVNYAHLWLALIAPSTPAVELERRKYAALAGNIQDDLYPVMQAAITGRASLDTSAPKADGSRPSSMLELGVQTKEDLHVLRAAMAQEGLMLSIFDLLRKVPRRMIMVLKVNDLTRALDASLHTTHGASRIFLIVAEYCNLAIYQDDQSQLLKTYRSTGLSFSYLSQSVSIWWRYTSWRFSIGLLERGTDWGASFTNARAWWRGYRKDGLRRAYEEAAGIL